MKWNERKEKKERRKKERKREEGKKEHNYLGTHLRGGGDP